MTGSASPSAHQDHARDEGKHSDTRPSTTTPKFTRCRTGCLRCRKRRRKCDERKPRCRNCIDKNFDCIYGMQVTFLPKNSITVKDEELSATAEKGDQGGGYERIQFVNEDPLSIENLVEEPEDETQLVSPALSVSGMSMARGDGLPGKEKGGHSLSISDDRGAHQKHWKEGTGDANRDSQFQTSFAPWELDHDSPVHPLTQDPYPNPPAALEPPILSSTFSAKDEFAVRGLLALGTQPGLGHETIPGPVDNTGMGSEYGLGLGATVEPRPGTPITTGPSVFADRVQDQPTPAARSFSSFGIGGGRGTVSFSADSGSTFEMWKMKLLQYYRYNVAPWLDIHDLNHSFGITALQTAVDSSSEQLLPMLMALSEACMQIEKGTHAHGFHAAYLDSSTESSYLDSPVTAGMDVTEAMLLQCLHELKGLVSDVPKFWGKGDRGASARDRLLSSLVDRAYGLLGMHSAVYWMFFRMDLGQSLANNTSLRIPLPSHSIPNLAFLSGAENTPERVGHYAQALLSLCGKALGIYHEDTTNEGQAQARGPETWLQTFEDLSQWHYLRPQEFQPMVELSQDSSAMNPDSEFPILLFTNGAGTLCNQLYHTAMLFMLDCKPRTATAMLNQNQNKDYPHYSRVLSPLWHAQRVCGIALNNDRREYWDPCLLASFLVAARHMTHESQQVEIVRGFDRIQALTGWSAGEYLTQLREEWSFLDGDY